MSTNEPRVARTFACGHPMPTPSGHGYRIRQIPLTETIRPTQACRSCDHWTLFREVTRIANRVEREVKEFRQWRSLIQGLWHQARYNEDEDTAQELTEKVAERTLEMRAFHQIADREVELLWDEWESIWGSQTKREEEQWDTWNSTRP